MKILVLIAMPLSNTPAIPSSSGIVPSLPASLQSLQASPSPQAPLHDIVGPFSFFAYTPTQILLALVVLLFLLGILFWGIRKLRQKPPLTPREACLQQLLQMKEKIMEGSDHEFGSLVSGLLRGYLGVAFGLAAPRQTTEEFLESLRGHKRFTLAEQKSLETFLTRSDFLKFAHREAAETDRLSLIAAAEHFVQGNVENSSKKSEEDSLL
ncbi:MAG: DUF4381 family protein [Chthoniobacterales bacterium]